MKDTRSIFVFLKKEQLVKALKVIEKLEEEGWYIQHIIVNTGVDDVDYLKYEVLKIRMFKDNYSKFIFIQTSGEIAVFSEINSIALSKPIFEISWLEAFESTKLNTLRFEPKFSTSEAIKMFESLTKNIRS